MAGRYKNPDDDPRGPWTSSDLTARNPYSLGTYPVTTPSGRVIPGPPPGRYWTVDAERFAALVRDGRVWWGRRGDGRPRLKRFVYEVKQGKVPQTLWLHGEVGHTQEAKKELLERVEFASSDGVFDTPKPLRLIQRVIHLGTRPDTRDIVLDFFAGSGTTGEAVWRQNRIDGGDRTFILVQSPVPTGCPDHETIADITRARLRHASQAMGTRGVTTLVPSPSNGSAP